MNPDAALELQIARYRAMSREQRVGIALRLHELACEMARLGIRRQYPNAPPAEVERLLRQRLALAHTLCNRITPSERQLADVAGVVQVQRQTLDEPHLRRWAAPLGVSAELEAALSGALRPKST